MSVYNIVAAPNACPECGGINVDWGFDLKYSGSINETIQEGYCSDCNTDIVLFFRLYKMKTEKV